MTVVIAAQTGAARRRTDAAPTEFNEMMEGPEVIRGGFETGP
jgi:hypothetical protein